MPKKLVNALTPFAVKNAKPGRHADGGGLQLLVKESGARSWIFRFMLKGKSRDVGLGPAAGAGAIPLAKARDLADALRVKVKAGVDPLAERERDAAEALAAEQAAMVAGVTFRAMAETHIAANKESWRNAKHKQQWENTLKTNTHPVIGDLPVAEVDTPHVIKVLEPIWREIPETAMGQSRLSAQHTGLTGSAKTSGSRSRDDGAGEACKWS